MINKYSFLKQQSGVVLVISLIMLLLLTLIGVTGTQVTGLEEKMAGNVRDQNISFQAAESTLLEAERVIAAADPSSIVVGDTLIEGDTWTNLGNSDPDFFDPNLWVAATSAPTPDDFGDNFGISADPRFIIKKIHQNGTTHVFRITARAVGRTPGTQVILQEIFEPDP